MSVCIECSIALPTIAVVIRHTRRHAILSYTVVELYGKNTPPSYLLCLGIDVRTTYYTARTYADIVYATYSGVVGRCSDIIIVCVLVAVTNAVLYDATIQTQQFL